MVGRGGIYGDLHGDGTPVASVPAEPAKDERPCPGCGAPVKTWMSFHFCEKCRHQQSTAGSR